VLQTSKENIDTIYREGELSADFDLRYKFKENQNEYVVLNDKIFNEAGEELYGGSASVITRVQGDKLKKLALTKDVQVSGLRPRNKEQTMALDSLLDPTINVVTLTGSAGTGKTVITLAAALHLVDQGSYEKVILTRPMTQCGKQELGILPGEVEDKFGPYLKNYMCNFEHLLGKRLRSMDDLIDHYNMEFVPFQLIRGASWPNTIIIADEIQTLPVSDMLTLGTRVGDNSKLIILGDLNQRDERIAKEKTGLFIWVNSEIVRRDKVTASINLIKNERSYVSQLFSEVLGG